MLSIEKEESVIQSMIDYLDTDENGEIDEDEFQ